MAIPLLSIAGGSLTGKDRSGDVALTGSGALRAVPFDGAQGFLVEEATTQLVGNPWHAVNTAGWTGTTRDISYALQGPASGLITATGANAEATYALTLPAVQHAAQVIVRNNAASSRSMQLRYNGANVGSAVTVAAGAVATLMGLITGTAASAPLGVRVTDSAAGETANVAYLGCEAKSYVTTPCPEIDIAGNPNPGYAWTGTAHASASTRAAGAISAAIANHAQTDRGSVYVRAATDIARYGTAMGKVLHLGQGATGQMISMGISGGRVRLSSRQNNGGYTHVLSRDSLPSTQASWSTYAEWDNAAIGVRYDNTSPIVGGTRPTPFATFDDQLWIGCRVTASEQFNGVIGPILIYDRPLTDAERATLDATPTALLGWDTLSVRAANTLNMAIAMSL